MPHIGTQAVYVRGARTEDVLRLADPQNMPTEDFTVEAYVQLESIYEDASVRVIASQWDGKQTSPGWSFGVTSTKSKHDPRNLILQLVGTEGYEVIPSDLRIDLHKTYYVAVSAKIADTSEAGITFYVKDITDMDAPLKSVSVRHRITGAYAGASPLIIGGRDSAPMHGWDGLIDEVRISKNALAKDELLFNGGSPAKGLISGHWVFEDQPGIFKDSAAVQKDLSKPAAGAKASAKPAPRADAALIDLCHVLLNSSEFLYLD